MKIFNKTVEIEPSIVDSNTSNGEEWIWVDGYKGVGEQDDRYYGYGMFEYEVGKEYETTKYLSLCNEGFHFCRELNDVFSWVDIYSQVYCTNPTSPYIYGIVYNKDYKVLNTKFFKVKALVKKSDWDNYKANQKYVAKKIILTEEISYEDMWDSVQDKNIFDIENIKKEKLDRLTTLGYSQTFAQILIDEKFNMIDKAIAYVEEGLSLDMRAYLLMR